MDPDSYVVYQHYEKPKANKQILKSQFAQSDKCKRSVYINEVVHRILNTSARLDLSECGAPVLTDYCVRMKKGGYGELYRKRTLEQALRIYYRLVADEKEGVRPLHRPKDWCPVERRQKKARRNNN